MAALPKQFANTENPGAPGTGDANPRLSGRQQAISAGTATQQTSRSKPDVRQPLNSMDRFELMVHDVLRSVGHPGHFQQTLAWCDGRLDETKLGQALDQLARRFPIVNARLRRKGGQASWEFPAVGRVKLNVTQLRDGDDAAVWRHAERLLAIPMNPEHEPPISFHLVRRPNAHDVLIVQWVHALMDGKAGEFVLNELNTSFTEADDAVSRTAPLMQDEIKAILQKRNWRYRWKALLSLRHHRLREPARMLVDPGSADWVTGPVRLAARTLDEDRTAQLFVRTRSLLGFMNPAPVLLASALRAADTIAPDPHNQPTLYRNLVPVNLRAVRAAEPIFRNMITYITFVTDVDELRNRDDLSRSLQQQMRDQFRRHADIGMLMAVQLANKLRRMTSRRLRNDPQGGVSFGFGYHGETSKQLQTLCGVPLQRLFTATAIASPPGFALSIGLHQGRLNIVVTYVEACIPEARVAAYLDAFESDLMA